MPVYTNNVTSRNIAQYTSRELLAYAEECDIKHHQARYGSNHQRIMQQERDWAFNIAAHLEALGK